MQFIDAAPIAKTRRTADGYLVAEVRTARTGIQDYAGHEVGKPEKAVVKVYRPADQVFDTASMGSYAHKPVTNNHPTEAVTADNWKAHSVGAIGDEVAKDGEFVRVPLILMDAAAIKAVEDGKRELSAGYTCDLKWDAGTTPDGVAYDAIQTAIRINHVAIVDRGRAGSKARIGDGASWGASPFEDQSGLAPITTSKKGDTMSDALKTVVLGDKAVQVAVTDVAAIDAFKAETAKTIADIEAKSAAAIAAKDADLAKKDAEIDDLKAKVLSDTDIDKRVQDRADLIAVAATIAKDVKTAGLSDAAIRKAVVVAKVGDAAIAGKPEAYIDARFDILADAAKAAGADPVRAALLNRDTTINTNDNGQAAYEQRLTDAWKIQAKGA